MKKTVWTFGLISGGIVSLLMLAAMPFQDAIGDRGEILGYTTMILAFLLIFFGVRSYRDTVAGGSVSFGRAFAVGASIALIASVCYTATWEVVYFGFKTDFVTKYQAHQIDKVKASGASQVEIDRKMAEMRKFAEMYQNPVMNAAMTMVEPLPLGLAIALVSAGILRRGRRREGQTMLATH